MTEFEIQFAAAADALYESSLGLAAAYTAPDGTVTSTGADGAPLMIRVQRHDARQVDDGGRVAGEQQTGTIIVRQSQLAKIVRGGRFTAEGNEVWTIETTPTLKNGQHYCTCSRSGAARLMPRRKE